MLRETGTQAVALPLRTHHVDLAAGTAQLAEAASGLLDDLTEA